MVRRNVLVASIAIFLIFYCDRTSSQCTQLTACSCLNSDGQQFDLSNLSDSEALQATLEDKTNGDSIFYFHPCKNYKFPSNITNECNTGAGVSLCEYDPVTKKNISLGSAEETTMKMGTRNPVLVLNHGKFMTTIELLCCDSCQSHLAVDSPAQEGQYHLSLTSPSACGKIMSRGLSTGSVLVILFCVFSGLYFIGGAITLKFLRGATGWEMLPNHKFWSDLPSLVREGVMFSLNSCKLDTYERI